jgi:hypothetical protein
VIFSHDRGDAEFNAEKTFHTDLTGWVNLDSETEAANP